MRAPPRYIFQALRQIWEMSAKLKILKLHLIFAYAQ